MCKGSPCELPFCTYRSTGSAMGKKRPEPSVRGRDAREQAHAEKHAWCESCKIKPATEIHHVGGRGMGGAKRKTAALQHLCSACHQGQGHSTRRRGG